MGLRPAMAHPNINQEMATVAVMPVAIVINHASA
jgi:hypothetical protein